MRMITLPDRGDWVVCKGIKSPILVGGASLEDGEFWGIVANDGTGKNVRKDGLLFSYIERFITEKEADELLFAIHYPRLDKRLNFDTPAGQKFLERFQKIGGGQPD